MWVNNGLFTVESINRHNLIFNKLELESFLVTVVTVVRVARYEHDKSIEK